MSNTPTKRPILACEISSQHVAAARVANGMIAMHSIRRLASGSVTPSLNAANVADPDAVRRSVSEALTGVGGAGRNRHVTVVVPDAAVRVLLLDFDTLPNNTDEAKAIIRFRLKKTLPFDVEHSAISFDQIESNGSIRAIVAVSPSQVVSEYEQVVRDAGYEPGIVVPSVLATLGTVDPDRATLVVKVDKETTSMVLADSMGLRLIRTLEHPGGSYSQEELLRGVHASLIYYEDTFGQQIANVYLAGNNFDPASAGVLGQEFQVRVSELNSGTAGGDSRALLAGVEGALLQ